MAADSIEEMRVFAARIRMNPDWIQLPPKTRYPHFDLNRTKRVAAVKLGAVEIGMRDMVPITKKLFAEFRQLECDGSGSALDRAIKRFKGH